MEKRVTLEKYKQAFREMKEEGEKRRFVLHLCIFGAISIMFLIVDWVYFPQFSWFLYPIVGWAVGLVIHYMLAVRWIESELTQIEAETEYRAKYK